MIILFPSDITSFFQGWTRLKTQNFITGVLRTFCPECIHTHTSMYTILYIHYVDPLCGHMTWLK